jgi:hypothetical protein
MRLLKTLVAVVTLAAVAAQPALAALHTCCCIRPVEAERSCCAAKHAEQEPAAGAAPHSCCATKMPAPAVVQTAGCCCVKTSPAVPTARDLVQTVTEQSPQAPVSAVVDLFDAAPAACGEILSAEARPLTGPPLLALYCIWRK